MKDWTQLINPNSTKLTKLLPIVSNQFSVQFLSITQNLALSYNICQCGIKKQQHRYEQIFLQQSYTTQLELEREREHTVFVEHVVALEATSEPIEGLTCFPDPESDGVDRFAKTHSVSGGRQRKFDSAPRGGRMGGGELLERGRSKWRAMERRRIRESGVVASVEVWGQENSFTIYNHRLCSTIFYIA